MSIAHRYPVAVTSQAEGAPVFRGVAEGNHRWGWFLTPDPPRRVPHERAWNVGFRTLHLIAFGVLLGGHFWGVAAERLLPALWITIASGAALMGLELYKSFEWLFLGKGLMVLAKFVLLLSVLLFWDARVPLLLLVVAVASVGAHMPARYRHYSVIHRRILLAETKSVPGTDGRTEMAKIAERSHRDLLWDPPPESQAPAGRQGESWDH